MPPPSSNDVARDEAEEDEEASAVVPFLSNKKLTQHAAATKTTATPAARRHGDELRDLGTMTAPYGAIGLRGAAGFEGVEEEGVLVVEVVVGGRMCGLYKRLQGDRLRCCVCGHGRRR